MIKNTHCYNILVPQAPYEHSGGCQDRTYCMQGLRCISKDECSKCTLGQCIQLAKENDASGFSYSPERNCRLCTTEKLKNLEKQKYWAVYRRRGNQSLGILFDVNDFYFTKPPSADILSFEFMQIKISTMLHLQLHDPWKVSSQNCRQG